MGGPKNSRNYVNKRGRPGDAISASFLFLIAINHSMSWITRMRIRSASYRIRYYTLFFIQQCLHWYGRDSPTAWLAIHHVNST